VAADGGGPAAMRGVPEAAVGYLVLAPCEGALHCNAGPNAEGPTIRGGQIGEAESPGIRVATRQ